MKIADRYSHKGADRFIEEKHPGIIAEIESVITLISAESCRLKTPLKKEVTRAQRAGVASFYSPIHINALLDYHLHAKGWDMKPRVYTLDRARVGSREMDFVKDRVGLEVQLGKYAFLTYDIVAKMVIFANKEINLIDCGIEICPMASMLPYMSSGIGAFEQVRWDLYHRGIADIDIPVLVLGIESETMPSATPELVKLTKELIEKESTAEDQDAEDQDVGEAGSSKWLKHQTDATYLGVRIETNRYKDGLSPAEVKKINSTGLSVPMPSPKKRVGKSRKKNSADNSTTGMIPMFPPDLGLS